MLYPWKKELSYRQIYAAHYLARADNNLSYKETSFVKILLANFVKNGGLSPIQWWWLYYYQRKMWDLNHSKGGEPKPLDKNVASFVAEQGPHELEVNGLGNKTMAAFSFSNATKDMKPSNYSKNDTVLFDAVHNLPDFIFGIKYIPKDSSIVLYDLDGLTEIISDVPDLNTLVSSDLVIEFEAGYIKTSAKKWGAVSFTKPNPAYLPDHYSISHVMGVLKSYLKTGMPNVLVNNLLKDPTGSVAQHPIPLPINAEKTFMASNLKKEPEPTNPITPKKPAVEELTPTEFKFSDKHKDVLLSLWMNGATNSTRNDLYAGRLNDIEYYLSIVKGYGPENMFNLSVKLYDSGLLILILTVKSDRISVPPSSLSEKYVMHGVSLVGFLLNNPLVFFASVGREKGRCVLSGLPLEGADLALGYRPVHARRWGLTREALTG